MESKQTDEDVDKWVSEIVHDVGMRKAFNGLFDDIQKCFFIGDSSFDYTVDKEIHKIDKGVVLRSI
jgi:hypothetical protein